MATTLLLLLMGVSLLLTGCERPDTEGDEYEEEDITVQESRFGAPYEIRTGDSPSEPDVPPGLINDSLFVQVGYRGGCDDHDFRLHHETSQDTTRFWLEHRAPGDDCNDYISEDLAFAVPDDAIEAPTVVLLNPQGYDPHVLRWGELNR